MQLAHFDRTLFRPGSILIEFFLLSCDGVVKTSIYSVVALFPILDIPYVCLRT